MNGNEGINIHIKNNATQTVSELDKVLQKLSSISSQLDKIITNTSKSAETTKKATKEIDKMDKALKGLGFATLIKGAQQTGKAMMKYGQQFSDYIEDLNVLKVAFGDTADVAKDFVENIADVTGFDEATLTRMTATFRQLSSTLGLANKDADLLSTNLTKMALDVSSLYNLDLNTAQYALQGALTAQPRSIKTHTGADVTQDTLQADLARLGIDRKVRSLNQAEKAIVTYLSLERQLINSNGDLARTIEQPANMLKIFKEQLTRAGRSIGNLFIPIIKTVIPYLTGFLMVFSEIVEVITSFLGIDTDAFWESMESGSSNISANLGSIAESAKSAQKSLRGFDKLNVIKTPTSSGGSGGLGLGIDNRLLDALKKYDLNLDSIRTKATDIRDRVMKVLGFQRKLNEETGEWEWVYGGISETIKGLTNEFKKLSPRAKKVSGFIAIIAGVSTYTAIKKLIRAFGNTGLGKAISNLLTPTTLLAEGIFKIGRTDSIKKVVNDWYDVAGAVGRAKTALVGTGGFLVGLDLVKSGIKDIANESVNAGNIIETSVGGITTLVSGALTGASIGGFTGGIIGLALGGIGLIVSAFDEVDTAVHTSAYEIEELGKKVETAYSTWIDSVDTIKEAYSKTDAETEYYQRLWSELKNITDENGKIQKGYEDRATTIATLLSEALGVEIEVVDGNIKKWKELQGEIDDYIIKRKNAMKLDVLENEAKKALEELNGAQENVVTSYGQLKTAQENFMKRAEDKAKKWYGISAQQLYDYAIGMKSAKDIAEELGTTEEKVKENLKNVRVEWRKQIADVKNAEKNYETANKTLDGYRQTIKNYEKALSLSLQGNEKALDEFFDHEQFLYEKSYSEQEQYWKDRKLLNELSLKELEENRDKYSKKDYETLKTAYENEIALTETQLENLKLLINTKNGKISSDMISQWITMAETSESEFITKLSELPTDIQNEVINKMYDKGFKISEELQKGLDEQGVTIKIDSDTSKATTGLSNFFTKWNEKLANLKLPILENGNYGSVSPFKLKADGGFVNTGEMFVAREAGPELVGRIGNKTAVANNQQIVDAVAQGVTNAIMASGGFGKNKVVIEAHGDADGMMNFITFKQKEQDMQYGN